MGSKIESLMDRATQWIIKETKEGISQQATMHPEMKINNDQVFVHQTDKAKTVIIPVEMNKLQGSYSLLKQFEEEEVARVYTRTYSHYFVNDFLTALGVMIPKYFGMLHISQRDTNGDPAINDYVQFPIKFDSNGTLLTEKGYIGSLQAPVWESAIVDIIPSGTIRVRSKMKFEKHVDLFLADIEGYLKKYSVVRGTSVKVRETNHGLMTEPINPKTNKTIVLSEGTERLISNLIIPSLRDRSKTALLFTGDFGTGKTETAIRVGLAGEKLFGRTFFYIENAGVFNKLVPYIKNYQPSTVFVEDIDQISAGDRDSDMNNLLNQLDGNELKNVDVTFIFTTNNHDKIHPAMRRPGRIDQVLHFDYCDVASIAKIFAIYADGMKGFNDVDFEEAALACPDKLQGAVVAEISRRAVKYANNLNGGKISTELFLTAIDSMRHHIEFMRKDQKEENRAEDILGKLLHKGLKNAFPNLGEDDGFPDFANQSYKNLPK